MRHYKTFDAFLRSTQGQISMNTIIAKRMYHKGTKKWENFEIEEDVFKEIAKCIYSNPQAHHIENMRRCKECGLFGRIVYSRRRNEWEYVAGQDYVGEMRTMQNIIRKS